MGLRHLHFVMEFISWMVMFWQAAWGELFFPVSGETELFLASLVIGSPCQECDLEDRVCS